jgi:hypothetical protein
MLGTLYDFSYGSMVDSKEARLTDQHITATGLVCILMYCFISAFAGVYTEYILKKDLTTSLHLQNMMLYTFTISLNFVGWLLTAAGSTDTAQQGLYMEMSE